MSRFAHRMGNERLKHDSPFYFTSLYLDYGVSGHGSGKVRWVASCRLAVVGLAECGLHVIAIAINLWVSWERLLLTARSPRQCDSRKFVTLRNGGH